jgi:hypothetical protein
MFFTTATGEDASDKYHKSGFQFSFSIFARKQGGLASPTGGNIFLMAQAF